MGHLIESLFASHSERKPSACATICVSLIVSGPGETAPSSRPSRGVTALEKAARYSSFSAHKSLQQHNNKLEEVERA